MPDFILFSHLPVASGPTPADLRQFAGDRPSEAMDGADAPIWAARQPTGACRCIEVGRGWN